MTSDSTEPLWLPCEQIIRLNGDIADEDEGTPTIADTASVERALQRSRDLWSYHGERDVVRLACGLMVGLLEARPFARHNKQTALAAMLMFLEANGYRWNVPDGPVLAAYVNALAEGRYTEEGLAETLRPDVFLDDGQT